MKLYLALFIIGHALAAVPDAQLSAQIEADKLRHQKQQQSLHARSGTGGRILRQQPAVASASASYEYPPPKPSFFLPSQTTTPVVQQPLPAQFVSLPSPIQPVPAPQALPTQPTFPTTVTQYLPPVSVLASITTSPPPKADLISIEPIPTQTIPPIRSPITTTTPAAVTQPSSKPPQQIAAASTISVGSAILPVMNMALMPQQPTVQMAQIASLNVDCAKESMLVKIKFDRPFGGLIYSKGHHGNVLCHHVRYNTNKDSYEFTIRLNSCGSQWVDELASGGKAYLENVIIIQNEPGIQEIWDSSRSIRCYWEGSLEKTVKYAFNIDMLDTQIVSFSGDTASASMDIQIGKGPLAPSVNGLVKIGDTLTMLIAIEGDPGFDVQVQECIAHDGDRSNAVTLTDKRGCVLKKKLMGPWQKSNQTGRPGTSLVAFSFFQAFKFPDKMEVFLECNVELCKSGCDVCPEDVSLFDVRSQRSRRAAYRWPRNANLTDVSDVRLRRSFRVISNEDIAYKPDSRSTVTLTTGE